MFHGTDNNSIKWMSKIFHDNVSSFCLGKKNKNVHLCFSVSLRFIQSLAFLIKIALSVRDSGFGHLDLVTLSKATFRGSVPSKVRRAQCSYVNKSYVWYKPQIPTFPSYLQCLHSPLTVFPRRQTRKQPYLSGPYLNLHSLFGKQIHSTLKDPALAAKHKWFALIWLSLQPQDPL